MNVLSGFDDDLQGTQLTTRHGGLQAAHHEFTGEPPVTKQAEQTGTAPANT